MNCSRAPLDTSSNNHNHYILSIQYLNGLTYIPQNIPSAHFNPKDII